MRQDLVESRPEWVRGRGADGVCVCTYACLCVCVGNMRSERNPDETMHLKTTHASLREAINKRHRPPAANTDVTPNTPKAPSCPPILPLSPPTTRELLPLVLQHQGPGQTPGPLLETPIPRSPRAPGTGNGTGRTATSRVRPSDPPGSSARGRVAGWRSRQRNQTYTNTIELMLNKDASSCDPVT